MKWISKVKEEETVGNYLFSFNEYMNFFEQNPIAETRTTASYLIDMMNYFGKNDRKRGFKLFSLDLPDSPPIYGQYKAQDFFYQNLINFTEEGFNNRFILLVGPNGSSKTSFIKKIMSGAERYSQLAPGSLFTFSWIFPLENYTKGALGLTENKPKKNDIFSYAGLEDKEIAAILQSELKDHPLLLIPKASRQTLIEELLKEKPEQLKQVKKTYLYQGDLSKRNRMIYDALLKNYQGDHFEVLKHIRVERFFIDRKQSHSAVTIEPQMHVDAQLQQITMDKRLASLPPSLQSLNLFNLSGENIYANRGILEFSDLLKRPIETFKYLLSTIESKSINLRGILTDLDILYIGTSNELHLNAFKQHPDFKSFKGRFNFMRVPYLLDYSEESKIYSEQIESLSSSTHFEPNALTALAMWSVMTRFRAPAQENYSDEKLGSLVELFSPLDKALFIAKRTLPKNISGEDKQILLSHYQTIVSEYDNDATYEGMFGISPREIKQIIYELSVEHKNITFVEIIESLERISLQKTEYDFLNFAPNRDYHDSLKALTLIKDYFLYKLDNEVRESLGLIDARSYEDYLKKYVQHVSALLKKEKVKNPITGQSEEPSRYTIEDLEKNVAIQDAPEIFRSSIIGRLGAYALDNPGKEIIYTNVFPDIVKTLKETFRNEQKNVIAKIANNLMFYKEAMDNLDNKNIIKDVISNMCEKYGYSKKGALTLIEYLIKHKYQE